MLMNAKRKSTLKLELFHYCDLELDPMIFISGFDLDTVVTYIHAQNEVNTSNGSEVIIRTDTHIIQTDHYLPALAKSKKRKEE